MTTSLGTVQERSMRRSVMRRKTRLPDGIEFHYYNKLELLYIYDEIFDSAGYESDLIQYRDGNVVVDVGANIGLFIHYLTKKCRSGTIYSIEPVPDLFEVLQANAQRVSNFRIHLLNCALSNTTGKTTFNFFPHCTVRSSKEISGSPIETTPESRSREFEFTSTVLDEMPIPWLSRCLSWLPGPAKRSLVGVLMRLHAKSRSFECELKTVSTLIDENSIEAIDILKVDVEGSEAEVLRGIEERHWPRIRQLMVEVHQRSGPLLDEITGIITAHGYRMKVAHNPVYPFPIVFAAR